MKRRNFVALTAASTLAAGKLAGMSSAFTEDPEIYELSIYTLTWPGRATELYNYFSNALIPLFNSLGIKNIGIFEEKGGLEPKKIYTLIPYPSMELMLKSRKELISNKEFLEKSEEYRNSNPNQKIYERIDTRLFTAFSTHPKLKLPDSQNRIFELRIYEGYNEDATNRKVDMFDNGEIDIFDATKLNTVFFGHAIAGANLPNLTYMLWFEDYEQRDKHWSDFVAHPDWKRMSSMEEYANTVSKIERIFLEPVNISQI